MDNLRKKKETIEHDPLIDDVPDGHEYFPKLIWRTLSDGISDIRFPS